MKDFLKFTFATVVGLTIFCCIGGFFMTVWLVSMIALASSSSSSTTVAQEHSVYVLSLSGSVVDNATDDYSSYLQMLRDPDADQPIGLNDIIDNIKKAKENENIDGIYLRGGELACGYAIKKSIRDALLDFKESGKFIIAYAENYGQGSYYLASVADKVYLNSNGSLDWCGMAANVMFYSRLMEKVGVEMQVFKVGTFKSAVEPFIRTSMSEPNKLQYKEMIDGMWSVVREETGASRAKDISTLNEYADRFLGLTAPEELVELGMVDSLIYMQDIKTILTKLTGTEDYHLLHHSDMLSLAQKSENKSKNEIAILYAEGDINDSGNDGIVGKKIVREINKLAKDDDVKAVVLRVNSPGGSAMASEQIWHALTLLKEKKPLIVSMGDYAASGGYYISCVADSIFASPLTLTGSIGIFGLIPNVKKLTDKVGLDIDGIGTNTNSLFQANATYKGLNAEQQRMMQAEINRGYELFVKRCADGRRMTIEQIKAIAEGRVWTGTAGVKIGLVDKIGDVNDAVLAAARKAGIENDYKVSTYSEKEDIFTQIMNKLQGTDNEERALIRKIKQLKQLSERPQIMARMPYEVEIQ